MPPPSHRGQLHLIQKTVTINQKVTSKLGLCGVSYPTRHIFVLVCRNIKPHLDLVGIAKKTVWMLWKIAVRNQGMLDAIWYFRGDER